jgi:uncharacterized protein involved in outer membrane biogenesis
MKWLFKWAFRLALLLVVLVVVLVLSLDAIVKTVVERQIRAETGLDAKIGKCSVGILSPVAGLENFKLYNTAEFGGAPFIDIPELHVEYDRAALSAGKLHVTLMRFNLAEFDVVRNEAGQTNIVSLLARTQATSSKNGAAKRASEPQFTGVDVLNLSLGRVKFIDLKDPRQNREWPLNIQNQVFKNVKSAGDFGGLALFIALRGGGNLTGSFFGIPNPGEAKTAAPPAPAKK